MEKKTKEKGRPIWVLLILVLFAKNVLKFFSEGGDKIDICDEIFGPPPRGGQKMLKFFDRGVKKY